MKISKMRKVFPFYQQHGNLVYIGGVQRKLKPHEEDRLLQVLLRRKCTKIVKAFGMRLKQYAERQSEARKLMASGNSATGPNLTKGKNHE